MNKKSRDRLRHETNKKKCYYEKCNYKGTQFDSIFEANVAQYLDQVNIVWERNKILFPAVMEDGRVLHYLPDFFLPEHNAYLEVKGLWFCKEKRLKTYLAVEQNNLLWTHILLKEWKQSKRILRNRIDSLRKKS